MKRTIHRANTRGHANHGWLVSSHTFSFAGYYNPERIHFGALRVLNDDHVAAGMGFGSHPHDNMEIISIPLEGALEHKDNTGRHKIINSNDVQIMSAGRGIVHSEYNASKTDPVKFLQIWVFPKVRDIQPRYDQKTFDPSQRENQLQKVVAPTESENTLFINQDAWFSLGKFDAGKATNYTMQHPGNGAYIFVLNGKVEVDGEVLEARDAIGIEDATSIDIKALENAEYLVMDVPMHLN
ncbi:pirin family protein [Chitinophaga skermanii]|nr:pirin family protein [Chitinophaga skermanii]